jgi:D-amino-acid dehydrogenase
LRIAIIGAGLAGLSAAYALLQAGTDRVTVFERQSGPGLETSFANGAMLHPSTVEPWNSPGVLWDLLRDLGNEDATALLRLRALPSLIGWDGGWGLRFLRQSALPHHLENTRANLRLARYSASLMAEMRARGIDDHGHANGSLMLFRDRAALNAAQAWAERLAADGRRYERLTTEEALSREPALTPIASELTGALFNPDDQRADALLHCQSLAAHLAARGVEIRYDTSIQRLDQRQGRVRGVIDAQGRAEEADAVVLAAASHSPALARNSGLDIPIQPAKGYSLTLSPPPGTPMPRMGVMDAQLHVAVVPVGDDRLRIAGTAEFTGHDLTLNPRRIANLQRMIARVYPEIVAATAPSQQTPWTGLRPMVHDGLPLIGPTRVPGLYLNTGHGHLGWTQAAGSGRLLADLMGGRTAEIDARRYLPERVGL